MCLSTGGVPHLRSKVGGTPSQRGGTLARSGGTPSQVCRGGVPHLRSEVGGYPISGLGGVPQSGLDGGYPGYPPTLRWGTPPRQISIASTCYAVGGMPLAFTQEDFLVQTDFDKSCHVLSLLYLPRTWPVIILNINCQYCLKWLANLQQLV